MEDSRLMFTSVFSVLEVPYEQGLRLFLVFPETQEGYLHTAGCQTSESFYSIIFR